MQLDFGPGVLLVSKGEAHVLEARGESGALLELESRASSLRSERAVQPDFRCGDFDDLRNATGPGGGVPTASVRPSRRALARPELHRVNAKLFREFVHLPFCHEQSLRGSEPRKAALGTLLV